MPTLDQTTRVLGLALVALLWGCSAADDGAAGDGADAGNWVLPGGGGAQLDNSCLAAQSGGVGGLDCSGAFELRRVDNDNVLGSGEDLEIKVSSVGQGGTLDIDLQVRNVAEVSLSAPIGLASVRLDYAPAAPAEAAEGPAFRCLNAEGTTDCAQMDGQWPVVIPNSPQIAVQPGMATSATIKIRFKRYDQNPRAAVLTIGVLGDDQTSVVTVPILAAPGVANIDVSPGQVAWPFLQPGQSAKQELTITNVGDGELRIDKARLLGDEGFSLTMPGPDGSAGTHTPAEADIPTDILVAPSESTTVEVAFVPPDGLQRQASLVLFSNDPTTPNGLEVPLLGNSEVPCLRLVPNTKVSYGGIKVGLCSTRPVIIESCGSAPLVIDAIGFGDDTNTDEFSFDWSQLATALPDHPGFGVDGVGPTGEHPLTLAPNDKATIELTYCPGDITEKDDEGKPLVIDTAVIEVDSNAVINATGDGAPKNTVYCEGIGVEETCPVAEVSSLVGEEVVPQTWIELQGETSYSPSGANIVDYQWTVTQPAGSAQPLQPSPGHPNPKLLANAAGEYTFCLEVEDANGLKSCAESCVTVLVLPEDAIHVELLWSTPGDPDEGDTGPTKGADLDLHFASPQATGPDIDCDGVGDPWFSNPFDVFWFNAGPNWGDKDPLAGDDPSLDLDDQDGAGPENLNMAKPADGAYAIGVHYWNDHDFGVSLATVNVYILGELAFKTPPVPLQPLDMWYVGRLNWPNTMTAGAGAPDPIKLCYQTGDACLGLSDPGNPAGGDMWQASGEWCVTKCYYNAQFGEATSGGQVVQCAQ